MLSPIRQWPHSRMTRPYVAVMGSPYGQVDPAADPGSDRLGSNGGRNEDLRRLLLELLAADQEIRARLEDLPPVRPFVPDDPLMAEFQRVDRTNTTQLRRVIAEHGWPTITLVGEDGAQAAWALAQHADADPAFQSECLELLGRAVAQHEASPLSLAWLTDRVRLAHGDGQLYGTQFTFRDGRWKPQQLADDKVDERRRALGLDSLAQRTAAMNESGCT